MSEGGCDREGPGHSALEQIFVSKGIPYSNNPSWIAFDCLYVCAWNKRVMFLFYAVYGGAHWPHQSLRISRDQKISSIRHFQTTKVTAQQMCSLFSVGWTTATLCSLTSAVIRCRGCKMFKTMQRRSFFARADMNTLDHCSRQFNGCKSKKG